MKNLKLKHYCAVGAIFSIFFLLFSQGANFAFSQEEGNLAPEIIELNKKIEERKGEAKKIEEKQRQYELLIQKKQKEKATLGSQLSILENRLAKAELDISKTETEIDRVKLEVKKTTLEIKEKDQEIEGEKEHLVNVLRLIYENDQINQLEVLLVNSSLSEFLNQVKYLEDINDSLGKSLDDLKNFKISLEERKRDLNEKNKNLSELKDELSQRKEGLDSEKTAKNILLDQTRSSEAEYQRLLKLAKEEQQRAAGDIASLEKTVRAKLAQMSDRKLEFNDAGFIWPTAKNFITAYFHDPDYPFRNIFEHPAIDIRAGQGSSVKAAASGYVARARDAGLGYNYIMLVHGDGLSTVYGHVSKIYVKEDEYVVQGQIIGLSGGTPGTPGAGGLTTGPHLHFEVRLNGIPVNPLEYLP